MDTTDTKPNRTASGRSRRQPQRRRSNADRWGSICDGVLVLIVVGSALAIGTVHIPVLLAVSALALVGATLELMALRRVPWPAVVLAGFGLFSALQAISLPAAWIKRVSPVAAEVWLRCLVPFGEPALRHFPLSLDPSASIAEALKWLTYGAVYVMAMRARARRGSAWLVVLLFGSAVLVSLITLLHGIVDLPELYGLYHPDFATGRWNVGPFLNSNNLAGYAILGLFTGGGLLLSGRSPVPRLASMIGIGSITAALALTGSRAGVLSVLVAGFVALVWLLRAKGARVSARGFALALAPLVIGIAIAFALGTDEAGQFSALDVERKASVWLWSLPLIRDHALLGVGRGAFETAFPPYRLALDYDWAIVISHAENFVVQWIAEWGVPVGVCAVVVIVGYVLREWYKSRSDRLRFMVLTGILALFFQNFANLGLEIPALVIAAVVALAAGERATAVPSDEVTDGAKRVGMRVALASVPALGIWVAALAWSRYPVELERRELSAAYRELSIGSANEPATLQADELALRKADELEMRRVGGELTTEGATVPAKGGAEGLASASADGLARFRNRLHQAVLRHPGEAFFPLLGSLVAMRAHEHSALTWVARALELAPTNGPVHLVLAELMHSHGATTQAMMHLRLAGQYDRTLGGAVAARAPVWAPSIDLLMQAIPDGPYGQSLLLAACTKEQAIELKLDCMRRAATRSPGSSEVQLALAESLLAAIKAVQPPCKDSLVERCAAEAEIAIRSAARLDPKAWRPGYLLSKVLLARGDAAGAAQLLTRTCPQNLEGDECWHEALVVAMKGGANDATSTAADALAARECDGMDSCANMFSSLASVLESGGQLALASKFYIKAAEAEPSVARWLKVGEFAAQAHFNGVARAALERANHSFDASPTSRAQVELLRERVARSASGSPN